MEYRNSVGHRLGPHMAAIIRCDLGQVLDLNLDASQYESAPYPPKPLTKEQIHARGLNRATIAWSKKPMIKIEIKTVDTGERKQLFGHTARHVITTRKQTPLEGSHSQPQESVRDGWYIDLDPKQQISCDPDYMQKSGGQSYGFVLVSPSLNSGTETIDRPEFVPIGKPETGFALEEVTTSDNAHKSPDGTIRHASSKSEMIVMELQEGPLDPSLFEVPKGFRHVKQIERNLPLTSSNPVVGLWERVKYTVENWFSF